MYIGMADAGEAATAWPATWCYCFLEPKAVAYGDSLTPSSAWPKVVLLLELICAPADSDHLLIQFLI
jgi:hypothetical protein